MKLSTETISIRLATTDDASALAALASLDSSEVPAPSLLLAERAGKLQAALGLRDSTAVADPFEPTAELVLLLRVRARRVTAERDVTARLRGAISALRGNSAYAA